MDLLRFTSVPVPPHCPAQHAKRYTTHTRAEEGADRRQRSARGECHWLSVPGGDGMLGGPRLRPSDRGNRLHQLQRQQPQNHPCQEWYHISGWHCLRLAHKKIVLDGSRWIRKWHTSQNRGCFYGDEISKGEIIEDEYSFY